MSRRLVAGLIALMAAWAIFGLAFGAEAADYQVGQVGHFESAYNDGSIAKAAFITGWTWGYLVG